MSQLKSLLILCLLCSVSAAQFTPTPLPVSVETIADLATAAARTADGAIVSTTGYHASGDGGGSSYIYRRTGRSGVTLSAFYIAGPGADDYFEEIDKNSVNIKKFGCKGDNATDDTDAFIDAVEMADDLAVPLYVPKGQYVLSTWDDYISIYNDFTIRGDGEASQIIGPDLTSTSQMFYIRNTNGPAVTCERVSFSTWYRVFNFETCYENTFNVGVYTELGEPYTINLVGNYCDNFSTGFLGVNGGVKIRAESVRVQDNRLTNMGLGDDEIRPWAIDISLLECPSVTVTGNYVDTVGSADSNAEIRGINVDYTYAENDNQSATISNNTVKNVRTNCLSGQIAAIICLEGQVVMSNNIIDTVVRHNSGNLSSPEGLYTKASKSIVTGNTIIDVLGAEGCINMKGEYTGTASSEGSVCSNNVITLRSLPADPTVACTGISMAAPRITCRGNLIEGMNRGIVSIFTGQVIQGNTVRYCNGVGIEAIADVFDTGLVIKDNVITGIGNAVNESATGLYISMQNPEEPPYLNANYESIEITGNTFENFVEGPYSVAIRFIQGSALREAKKLVIKNNVCNNLNNFVSLLGLNTTRYMEMSGNSIYGADQVYVNTQSLIRKKRLLNIENGGFWGGNDSVIPYDPAAVSGLTAWWSTKNPEDIRNNATYTANDMEAIGEIYELSGNASSLLGIVTPIMHIATRSGLPSSAIYMRGLGDGFQTTMPAALQDDCTMFFVCKPGYVTHFSVDTDTNVISHDQLNFFEPVNDMPIVFHGKNLPAPLVAGTTYYVRDKADNEAPPNAYFFYSFKVAATVGGAAIDITSEGSGAFNYRTPDTKFTWWYQDPEVSGIAFTPDAGTDELTSADHGLANDTPVSFLNNDLPSPLITGTTYYVVNVTEDTFEVSATLAGAEIDLTDAGSGTMYYSTATDLRRTWSGEDGGAGDGEGVGVGTPTFRVNGTAADFTTTDDVFEATSETLAVITVEGLDFSGWSKGVQDFRLGGYHKTTDAGHVAGYFGACLIYDGPLSETDRNAIEAYLMDEWEIVN